MYRHKNLDLINFCYAEMGTKVETECSSNDDHPPTNLISSDPRIRSKGFLADYFIKPPVTVKFTFRHPIYLSKVDFLPQVGQQACNVFEVWAWTPGNCHRQAVKIGRGSSDLSNGNVVFQNFYFPGQRFRPEVDSNKFRLAPENVVREISGLEIKILRTSCSGIPCLKNVAIFGVATSNVDKAEVDRTLSVWKTLSVLASTTSDVTLRNADSSKEIQVEPSKMPTASSAKNEEVPADFLDALTHTRMDVPMVLPCGQVIDRKTLDLYNAEEAKWGRSPNDPFTGKLFTHTSRPVFDEKLKSRIDAFVLQHHHNDAEVIRKRRRDILAVASDTEASEQSSSLTDEAPSYKKCLDDVLNEALRGRRPIILSGPKKSLQACTVCGQAENLYEMGCKHLICRKCLEVETQNSSEILCQVCNKKCLKRDIIKFHSMSST